MVRDTVAVETLARLAISRIFIYRYLRISFLPRPAPRSIASVRLRSSAIGRVTGRHGAAPKIVSTTLFDELPAFFRWRHQLQTISGQRKSPDTSMTRSGQLWVDRQRMRIIGRSFHAVIEIRIKNIFLAGPKSRRRSVSAVRSARNSKRKLGGSRHIKNVVVKMAAFSPPVPIRKKQEVYRVPCPDVNCVVVDQAVFYGTSNVDTARAVILADVVAHDRACVAGAFFRVVATFVADQEKAAVVVVTVIILDDGIPAVPVGVEAFTVPLSFGSISFVVLNQRIVRAPGPDRHIVSIRPLLRMADHVVFDQSAVRCHHHDPIAADVVELVSANNDAQTGKPFRAHPRVRPAEDSTAVHVINFVVLDAQIHEAAGFPVAY